jgi:mannose-1-phosphate guanylyltransferase
MRVIKASGVNNAFILGAGLGTRLRPLTDHLPKPLVPLFHRPLVEWAMDACRQAGIQRFAINTHHLPEAWLGYADHLKASLFHEPVLLETGGGLKNIEAWIGDESLLVHNGDIFSTLPLHKLIAAHEASGLPVTLALRTEGTARHLALDETGTRVTDIRNQLGRAEGSHLFSGIYCIRPEFLKLLPADQKISVIPAFLQLAAAGQLGAVVLDEGVWLDLGDRESYLQAHRMLDLAAAIHPQAMIAPDAQVVNSVVGAGAVIGNAAMIRNSVIWPGCQIAPHATLDGCIVSTREAISGTHHAKDF